MTLLYDWLKKAAKAQGNNKAVVYRDNYLSWRGLLHRVDRRAQEFMLFARFPIAVPTSSDCLGQTLVQFADIRYTEPGAARGAFSVNVPVDCPAR